jgi:hypothetical protein
MDFGKLFSRAWTICWNNKFLFVLGFLAALGSGSTGSGSTPQANFSFSGDELPPGWEQNLEQFFEEIVAVGVPLLILLTCLALFAGIILWLVRLSSQAGLISAASRLDAGETVGLGEAFRNGLGYLGRMVGVNLLLFAPFILVGVVAAGIGFTSFFTIVATEVGSGSTPPPEQILGGFGLLGLCMCLLACILVPLWALVAVIYPFAQRGIVLGNLGVVNSIRHGWDVVRANAGEVLLLILFFFVLGILSGIVTALVMLPIGLLAFGPSVVDLVMGGAPGAGDIGFLIFGGLLMIVVGAVVNTLLITYRSVTVTLAYEEFVGRKLVGTEKVIV